MVYLQKRSKNAVRAPGVFGFFGGGAEKDENPEQALIREIIEELDVTPVNYYFFQCYNLERSEIWVYLQSVGEDFEQEIKVLDGEYGKWFSEMELDQELKIIDHDRGILADFFNYIKSKK